MPTSRQISKRKHTKRGLVRGEPVIRGVLNAALEELARTGYDALRVDDVAKRAGVNKTTVYRRWPTKSDLVRGALLGLVGEAVEAPSTGSLRGDLLEMGQHMIRVITSPHGRGIVRLVLAERPDSALMKIAQSIRDTFDPLSRGAMEKAVARGELVSEPAGMMMLDVLDAAIHHRYFVEHLGVDDTYLESLVDLLICGGGVAKKRIAQKRR